MMMTTQWMQDSSYRGAMQTLVGSLLLVGMLSPDAVWNAVGYIVAGIDPVMAIVSFNSVHLSHVGDSLFKTCMRVAGAIVGGGLGVGVMYLSYAANGRSWAPSVTKGAVLVVLVGLAGFFVPYVQQKYARYQYSHFVTLMGLTMVSLSGYELGFAYPLAYPFYIVLIVLGVFFSLMVSVFVFPMLAGKCVHTLSMKALKLIAEGNVYLVDEIMCRKEKALEESGMVVEEGGGGGVVTEEVDTDSDKTIEENEPTIDKKGFVDTFAFPASSSLIKAKALLKTAVVTEIDMYHIPHIFPCKEYETMLSLERHQLSLMMCIFAFLDGEKNLNNMKHVEHVLRPLVYAIKSCAEGISAVLDMTMMYKEVLGRVDELEACMLSVRRKFDDCSIIDSFEDDSGLSLSIVATMFVVGERMRNMFLVLPSVLEQKRTTESDVWDACSKQFHGKEIILDTDIWLDTDDCSSMLERTLSSLSVLTSLGTEERAAFTAQSINANEVILQKPSYISLASRFISHCLLRLDHYHVRMALQESVAVAIAAVFHVCSATNNFLQGHTIWIIFTIGILGPHDSIGGMTYNGLKRMLGTILGGAIGLATTYLAYLINGLSYSNSGPSKFIIMTIIFAIVNSLLTIGTMRSGPEYVPVWRVATIAVPIICFSSYHSETINPAVAGFRLACVAIGIFIQFVASSFVFPVGSSGVARHRMRVVMRKLMAMSKETCNIVFQEKGNDNTSKSIDENSSNIYVRLASLNTKGSARGFHKAKSRLVACHAKGYTVIRVRPIGIKTAGAIASLRKLEDIFRFEKQLKHWTLIDRLEELPCIRRHPVSLELVVKVRRSFRRALNLLMTCAYLKEGFHFREIASLHPVKIQIQEFLQNLIPHYLEYMILATRSEKSFNECALVLLQIQEHMKDILNTIEATLAMRRTSLSDQTIACAVLTTLAAIMNEFVKLYDVLNEDPAIPKMRVDSLSDSEEDSSDEHDLLRNDY